MIHLHTRSSYSLLESPLRIESIIALAQEAGQSAVALTDHTTMYGTMEFIQAAKEAKLKPIVGLEFDVWYQNQRISLLALAKNTQGLQALFQISTLLCQGAKWIEETRVAFQEDQESILQKEREEKKASLSSVASSFKNPILPFDEFLSLSKDLIVFNAGGDSAFEELANSDEDFVRTFFQTLQHNGATVAVAISLQDSPVFATTHLRSIALKEQLMAIALSRIEYERPKDVELLTLLKA
ncbi:MAG: PHP domain-containing protein, partial [Allobaculum sp.]|nr:PHP domain-containing protein [Allobaculum sp.]